MFDESLKINICLFERGRESQQRHLTLHILPHDCSSPSTGDYIPILYLYLHAHIRDQGIT